MIWISLTILFAYIIATKINNKFAWALLCFPSAIIAATISSTIFYSGDTRNLGETMLVIINNSVWGYVISIIEIFYIKYKIRKKDKEYEKSYVAGANGRSLSFDFGDFTLFLEGNPSKEKVQEYASALVSSGAKKDDILEILSSKLGKEYAESTQINI